MGKGKGLIIGMIAGGLIGVAATIIFGPELNEETRRRMRERGLSLRARADELAGVTRTGADTALDRARELWSEHGARLQEAIAEGKRAAADKQRELRAKFEQAQREGEAEL